MLRNSKEEQQCPLTEEGAEESPQHGVGQRREESAELAHHAQQQHEGRSVLDHPAAPNLQGNRTGHGVRSALSPASHLAFDFTGQFQSELVSSSPGFNFGAEGLS